MYSEDPTPEKRKTDPFKEPAVHQRRAEMGMEGPACQRGGEGWKMRGEGRAGWREGVEAARRRR